MTAALISLHQFEIYILFIVHSWAFTVIAQSGACSTPSHTNNC